MTRVSYQKHIQDDLSVSRSHLEGPWTRLVRTLADTAGGIGQADRTGSDSQHEDLAARRARTFLSDSPVSSLFLASPHPPHLSSRNSHPPLPLLSCWLFGGSKYLDEEDKTLLYKTVSFRRDGGASPAAGPPLRLRCPCATATPDHPRRVSLGPAAEPHTVTSTLPARGRMLRPCPGLGLRRGGGGGWEGGHVQTRRSRWRIRKGTPLASRNRGRRPHRIELFVKWPINRHDGFGLTSCQPRKYLIWTNLGAAVGNEDSSPIRQWP